MSPSSVQSEANNVSVKLSCKPVAPLSPSASIILVSPTNEILLLHRVSTSTSFPSAHVFPGGVLESSDGPLPSSRIDPARHRDNIAYRTAAIRELFEESGIILARCSPTSDRLVSLPAEVRNKGRYDIHGNKVDITSWLAQCSPSAVLDTASLIPFTRWVTPIGLPKRFTTQMYIYFLPTAVHNDENFVALSDEVETIAAEWLSAKDWLNRATNGQIILHPTQCFLLYLVSQFLSADTEGGKRSVPELEEQRQRLRSFIWDSHPSWTEKTISPTRMEITRRDGRIILSLDQPGPELEGMEGMVGDEEFVLLARFVADVPRDVEVVTRKSVMEQGRDDNGGRKQPSKI